MIIYVLIGLLIFGLPLLVFSITVRLVKGNYRMIVSLAKMSMLNIPILLAIEIIGAIMMFHSEEARWIGLVLLIAAQILSLFVLPACFKVKEKSGLLSVMLFIKSMTSVVIFSAITLFLLWLLGDGLSLNYLISIS